jgi:hypothetical protein
MKQLNGWSITGFIFSPILTSVLFTVLMYYLTYRSNDFFGLAILMYLFFSSIIGTFAGVKGLRKARKQGVSGLAISMPVITIITGLLYFIPILGWLIRANLPYYIYI